MVGNIDQMALAKRHEAGIGMIGSLGLSHVDGGATMRAHAHVEQHIQRLKDSGLCRMPFSNFEANANWMMTVAMAADLVRWFQLPCFDGTWVNARPKAMRWGLFHAPGKLVHKSRQLIGRCFASYAHTDPGDIIGVLQARSGSSRPK